jgi:hypothetical protein
MVRTLVTRTIFFWDGMKRDVKAHVAACDVCQRSKSEASSPAGLLQPLQIPTQVWEEISFDFIDGLPSLGGKTAIMVVVDHLTKYGHFVSLMHPYTAKKIAELFITHVVQLHSIPVAIVSDRDPTL